MASHAAAEQPPTNRLDGTHLPPDAETWNAEAVLAWGLRQFPGRIALASSFQAEDVVVIDLLARVASRTKLPFRVFSLDTGRLNQETYDVMDQIRTRYGITIEIVFPQREAVEEMVRANGLNLFYQSVENRVLCCNVRKVEPLNRALRELDAWITGVRREQVKTRATTAKIELDPAHGGIIKLNPLADWTQEQVWDYVRSQNLPYNSLYDRGYTSIGCEPCTRPIKLGEDPRAGRWWWELGIKECGLHYSHDQGLHYTQANPSERQENPGSHAGAKP